MHCFLLMNEFRLRTINTTRKYYLDGVFQNETHSSTETIMVHCDFGWGGEANGYYTSGIFNIGGNDKELDIFGETDVTTNYNWYLKIITYDNPNN